MAIDRWGGAPAMAKISLMKFVGGFTRPGYELALTGGELEALPGYCRDVARSREDAKRLLKETGVNNLKINFLKIATSASPIRPLASIPSINGCERWRAEGHAQVGLASAQLSLAYRIDRSA